MTEIAPERVGLRVSELGSEIARALRDGLPEMVWVRGELSNYRAPRGGNLYFDLVEHDPDRGQTVAKLSATVLRWERASFDRDLAVAPGLELADGVEVLLGGSVSYYEPWGRLQLKVSRIDPAYTLGALSVARDRVLADLGSRGLLRRNAAHDVPPAPLRVGVVVSAGSDAEADVLSQLRRSGFAFEVVLAHARVQGRDCEASVVGAVTALGRLHSARPLDVVVVARGGGSRLDLAGFDTAGVAEAIATAPFPVWSAIGHQQDRSVADEVSHTCWSTPTAAGQALATAVGDCAVRVDSALASLRTVAGNRVAAAHQRLAQCAGRLEGNADQRLQRTRRDLLRTATTLGAAPGAVLRGERQRVGRASSGLAASAPRAGIDERRRLERAVGILERATRATLERAGSRLELAEARVDAADPIRQLARGYTITRDAAGRALSSVTGLGHGDQITTELSDGSVASWVLDIKPRDRPTDRERTDDR